MLAHCNYCEEEVECIEVDVSPDENKVLLEIICDNCGGLIDENDVYGIDWEG